MATVVRLAGVDIVLYLATGSASFRDGSKRQDLPRPDPLRDHSDHRSHHDPVPTKCEPRSPARHYLVAALPLTPNAWTLPFQGPM
jgi:hypothetical protein